jgi:septal ring factor EnvC (AmiA/AmiB activator)
LIQRILLLLLVTLVSIGTGFCADSPQETEEKLRKIQSEISEVRSLLEKKRGEQGKLQAQLRRQDKAIARVSKAIKRLDRKLDDLNKTLSSKRKEKAHQLAILQQHQKGLAELAVAAYRMGEQQTLKLILNQDDPALMGRMLAYHRYIGQARARQIKSINLALADLREIEREINQKSRELKASKSEKQKQKNELVKTKKERKQTLASLSKEIRRKGKALDSLLEDEEQLQALIASLNEALSDIPDQLSAQDKFAQLKGKLSWPVRGEVVHQFGQSRKGTQGKLRWNGVTIRTANGTPINAIARGRVAFADWMRGIGLLVILDHGDGYLSLYGHNEVLYVAPGDWVEYGDIIGTVGNSGGLQESGLYFEIRSNSKPVNPNKWCKGKLNVAGL